MYIVRRHCGTAAATAVPGGPAVLRRIYADVFSDVLWGQWSMYLKYTAGERMRRLILIWLMRGNPVLSHPPQRTTYNPQPPYLTSDISTAPSNSFTSSSIEKPHRGYAHLSPRTPTRNLHLLASLAPGHFQGAFPSRHLCRFESHVKVLQLLSS